MFDLKLRFISLTLRKATWILSECDIQLVTSKYNSLVFRDHRQICGVTSTELSLGYLEVHHIKFQCTLGNGIEGQDRFNKLIEGVPKNEHKNLVVLCPIHHREVHQGRLCIRGYKDSSTGRILDYEFSSKKEKKLGIKSAPSQLAKLKLKLTLWKAKWK